MNNSSFKSFDEEEDLSTEEKEKRESAFWALYNADTLKSLGEEERNMVHRMMASLKETYIENPRLGAKLLNFIFRQFNGDTIHANIDHAEYKIALTNIRIGLHRLLFVDEFTWNVTKRDVIFKSVFNAFIFYLSMIRVGTFNDHQQKMASAKAGTHVHVMGTGGLTR